MSKAPKDDAVGYGRPPKASRFKKGQSGNPKGRPRKAKAGDAPAPVVQTVGGFDAFTTAALAEADRPVRMREGEAVVELPTRDAVMRKLRDAALKGDRASQKLFLDMVGEAAARRAHAEAEHSAQWAELAEIAQSYLARETPRVEERRAAGRPDSDGTPGWMHPEDINVDRRAGCITLFGPLDGRHARTIGAAACFYLHKMRQAAIMARERESLRHHRDLYEVDEDFDVDHALIELCDETAWREEHAPAMAEGLPKRFLDPAWYDVNVHLTWRDLAAYFGGDPLQLDPVRRDHYAQMAVRRFDDEPFHHHGPVETFEIFPAWRKAETPLPLVTGQG